MQKFIITHHRYFDLLQDKFNELNMIQLIKFNTWSRLVGNGAVGNILKESCLDHLYTNNSSLISNINSINHALKTYQ